MNTTITCPFCGEPTEVELDEDLESGTPGEHAFVQDCDVCCRPISISLRVNADGEVIAGYGRE